MLLREVGEGRIGLVTASSAAASAVPAKWLGGGPGSEPMRALLALPAPPALSDIRATANGSAKLTDPYSSSVRCSKDYS